VTLAADVPRIGTYWKGQGGVYAGTVRGEGIGDYHLIVGPETPRAMDYDAAVFWCCDQEPDGHGDFWTPLRREQSIAFANVPGLFRPTHYWSIEGHETQDDAAWCHNFQSGGLDYFSKYTELYARTFRRIPCAKGEEPAVPRMQ
jgi:hypothetical protein